MLHLAICNLVTRVLDVKERDLYFYPFSLTINVLSFMFGSARHVKHKKFEAKKVCLQLINVLANEGTEKMSG
jgi:hypothetical protein